MNPIGSVWRKWDLHIHTPASYHWKGQKFEGQSGATLDANCLAVIEAINKADADAFCIMDYWTFDGFITLRNYERRNPGTLKKKVFPGLEFRLEASTNYRLNAHVLLNDTLDDQELIAFQNQLKFSGPNGQPPIRANFIKLAKGYNDDTFQKHGFAEPDRTNPEKMFELGMKTAELSRDSLRDAIAMIKKENCLFILPFDTNDGFAKHEWELHPYADHAIMQWADCYEAKDPIIIGLILGRGHPTKPNVTKNFMTTIGHPKPAFRGSDAHKVSEYAVYPNGNTTWLKAQPTFAGLRQVCHEPSLRCHIGDPPEKLAHIQQNPTKYIKSVRLSKVANSTLAEDWFDGAEVHFNPGLVAVIGNKGTGKSALADILALAANSHREEFQFLTTERFRGSGNKAQHFNAVLTWLDGSEAPVNLSQSVNQTSPERVRYLPQNIIEDLCNEIAAGNESRFSRELRHVIFAHVDTADKLGKASLDDLITYRLQAKKESFAQLQQSVRQLNETIAKKEQEASKEAIDELRSALALKETELEALNKSPIEEVAKPVANPDDEKTKAILTKLTELKTELEAFDTAITSVTNERDQLVADRATLTRLTEYVANFKQYHETFEADHSEEFAAAGFPIGDVIKVQIDSAGITTRLAEVETRIASLTTQLDGTPAIDETPAVPGLTWRADDCRMNIQKAENALAQPEKLYQKYLRDVAEREKLKAEIVGAADLPDTIEYLKARIERVSNVIPPEIIQHREERRGLVKQLHAQLLEMRAVYEELYAPIQKMATKAATSPHAVQIQFDAKIVTHGFEENFLDFIHKGRRGHFMGDDESHDLIEGLLRSCDFNSTEAVVAFTDRLLEALTTFNDPNGSLISLKSQLKDKKRVEDLYDFIFCLDYIEIRYTLLLAGKDISQLSPGEKGALLLVFYLLLDVEEIPIIIDQPEHNLDNESVVRLLVDCIREARGRRQVFIVTHNPNLAVYCDADQVICCSIDKTNGNKIAYESGAIEDYPINRIAVNVLEGTYAAFDNRSKKWHKPETP